MVLSCLSRIGSPRQRNSIGNDTTTAETPRHPARMLGVRAALLRRTCRDQTSTSGNTHQGQGRPTILGQGFGGGRGMGGDSPVSEAVLSEVGVLPLGPPRRVRPGSRELAGKDANTATPDGRLPEGAGSRRLSFCGLLCRGACYTVKEAGGARFREGEASCSSPRRGRRQ